MVIERPRSSQRFVAIVNPTAGGGRCAQRVGPALDRLRQAGLTVDVRPTERPGEGVTLARHAVASGCRNLIAVGGDGTANEVVNGIAAVPSAHRVHLGLLPLGTGNSFLHDFVPRGTSATDYALDALIQGQRRPCDVLRLKHRDGHRDFINVLGFGFPADVGVLVNRRLKALGATGYTVGVLAKLATLVPLILPHRRDQGPLHGMPMTFLCVCNSRFTGGTMEMAPTARIDDGEMDVVRVDLVSRIMLLRTFPKIFRGGHLAHPAVHHHRTRRLDFVTDRDVDINLDGEILRVTPTAIEVRPGAIEVAA